MAQIFSEIKYNRNRYIYRPVSPSIIFMIRKTNSSEIDNSIQHTKTAYRSHTITNQELESIALSSVKQ